MALKNVKRLLEAVSMQLPVRWHYQAPYFEYLPRHLNNKMPLFIGRVLQIQVYPISGL
mgnify:CR=1 FL=1